MRTTLENAIAQRRIAHGYIFSGQRGTGKTTVARIVARCLNCVNGPTSQPCGECPSCREIASGGAVDVIEIDAASNRGINEMRELRENVRYRPARDRYKVFIIDEAHQITNEAFNALLKTLEEPPEWVVFMMCTTEAHKIPTTIASRCQQFSFRSVDFDEVIARMQWICEQEGIETEPETLAVLAQMGEGSVRDSLSALDQAIACCGTKLNAAEVRELLGAFSLDSLDQVTQALAASDSRRMLEIVQELERNGKNLQHFCRELARYLRNLLVTKVAGKGTRLVPATGPEQERLAAISAQFSEEDLTRYLQLTLELFKDLQWALQPRLHLEIGLLKLVQAGRLMPIEQALAMVSGGQAPPAPRKPEPAAPAPQRGPAPRSSAAPQAHAPAPRPAATRSATTPASAAPSGGDAGWREKLCSALRELNMAFTADAIEHSIVVEDRAELHFTAPDEYCIMITESEVRKALAHLGVKPYRIKVVAGEGSAPRPAAAPASGPRAGDDASERALSHPDVQRFQQEFPSAQVRQVRNLKE